MAKGQGGGLMQFIRFGLVGISNTAVDWIVYYIIAGYIITATDARPVVKAISFVVAVLNSYLWNTLWTFKKEYQSSTKGQGNSNKGKIFVKFMVVSLVGWGINYSVFRWMFTGYNFADISLLGKTISAQNLYPLIGASAAATLWNFFGNKLWTYKK